MKEDKEIIERLGREWSRFWISAGMEVYHREMVDADNQPKEDAFVMIVDQVVKRVVKTDQKNGSSPFRIVGVQCHWFKSGEFQK